MEKIKKNNSDNDMSQQNINIGHDNENANMKCSDNDGSINEEDYNKKSSSPKITFETYKGKPVEVTYVTYPPPPQPRRVDSNNNNIIEEEVVYKCVEECWNFGILGEKCGRGKCGGVFAGHYMDKAEQIMALQFMKEKDEEEDADNSDESCVDSEDYFPEIMEDYGLEERPRT